MAFMMKKKKYKFNVEVQLQDLVEVALVNEVLFAKIRLLEGGSFQEYSSREEVKNHRVEWNRSFQFPCKMSANASTGVLDPSHLRISIRKEMKGGRSYFKLGFIDINLAEFAGAGLISRRFLLEGYDSRHRLDNSMLRVTIKMHMLSGDILFKAPTPSLKSKQKPSTDDLATASTGSGLQTPTANAMPPIGVANSPTNAVSTGLGSGIVPNNRPISTLRDDVELDPQNLISAIVTDSGLSESSESATTGEHLQQQQPAASTNSQVLSYGGVGVNSSSIIGSNNCDTMSNLILSGSAGIPSGIPVTSSIIEMGHSRNSSNTSQLSKGSGYSSFSHSQHSRQSSEGDSGHARFSKSVSLLIRLNKKTINAMQLSIVPAHMNQRTMSATVAITECADDSSEVFGTPNATLQRDEEFGTPLTELPANSSAGGLSADTLYGPSHSLSPTYYSIASSEGSRNSSHASEICEGSGSDSEADDSGLDENYHTPRVEKIKSMENLSLLEMEFHKASQEMDRNSPRRLKLMAEHARFPKMKSLNNLCVDNYSDVELKEKFSRMRDQSMEEKQCFQYQQRKYSNSSNSSGKKFAKHKVGNAKFIGGDETPDASNVAHAHLFGTSVTSPQPIQKMRSMGTIPDVVAERIEPDPFLTPTSGRKPKFPFVTQSAEKPSPLTYVAQVLNSEDVVDSRSLQDYYTQNRLFRISSEPAAPHISRSPFERAYKRSAIKSSTPFRQSIGYIQHQAAHDTKLLQQQQQQSFILEHEEPSLRRPQSTNVAYDLMRNPSSGSLVVSESGSLDRTKSGTEKRKKGALEDGPRVSDRVEETRVNPNSLIDEILKDSRLDQLEESAESSGLQLYIARDGTASLGSHEVKSRVNAGSFKQVVMQNPR